MNKNMNISIFKQNIFLRLAFWVIMIQFFMTILAYILNEHDLIYTSRGVSQEWPEFFTAIFTLLNIVFVLIGFLIDLVSFLKKEVEGSKLLVSLSYSIPIVALSLILFRYFYA
jgi:hypothetical protein